MSKPPPKLTRSIHAHKHEVLQTYNAKKPCVTQILILP